MKVKKYYILSLAFFLSLSLLVPSNAQSVSKNLTLRNFDMTLTFPTTANPGDSIVVSVNAVARSSATVIDLSIQVMAYTTEGGDLQSVGSASLISSQTGTQYGYQGGRYVSSGNTFHQDVSITVPTNILRGELVAVVTETVGSTSYYYSYSPYYYYYYPYSYNYPYSYSYPNYTYYYWYYPYYYTYYYPSQGTQQYVESKVLPCTYILATTPEYVTLKSQYDQLSSQYNDLSTKYQQATQQNQDLTNKLNAATQEANNLKMLGYGFIGATAILAVVAVAFIALYARQKRIGKTTPTTPPASTPQSGTAATDKK
jgi:hypothetical protein